MTIGGIARGAAEVDEPRMDPRARRTRGLLQSALLDLARSRDLDDISISEITAAAGVNRATFYLHYPDKDALLLEAMTSVVAETAVGAASAPQAELDDPNHPPAHTLAFFRELDQHAPLYRRVLGPNGSPAVVAHLRTGLQDAIATELVRRSTAPLPRGVSVELLAGFLAGAVFASATVWLDEEHRRSPDEIAAAVWLLASATVSALPHEPARTTARTPKRSPRRSPQRPTTDRR